MHASTLLISFLAVILPVLAAPVAEYAPQPQDDACAQECAVTVPKVGESDREAICSIFGLQTTLTCAECIDRTWPDTTEEDSAMAEYERIVASCQQETPQEVFRHSSF